MNKPLIQFRDEVQRLVTASVFQNEFGRSINLQIGFRKDGKLDHRSLTVVSKNIEAVAKVLDQAAVYLKENGTK